MFTWHVDFYSTNYLFLKWKQHKGMTEITESFQEKTKCEYESEKEWEFYVSE